MKIRIQVQQVDMEAGMESLVVRLNGPATFEYKWEMLPQKNVDAAPHSHMHLHTCVHTHIHTHLIYPHTHTHHAKTYRIWEIVQLVKHLLCSMKT